MDYRLVTRGAGLDLRPVQRHDAELHQAGPLSDLQSPDEQPLEDVEVPIAEMVDGVVVRVLVG